MKYPAHIYAKALAEAIAEAKGKGKEEGVIAKNFLAVVRRNGDEAHLKKIIEDAARIVRGALRIRKVTVESARPLASEQEKMVKQFMKAGDVIENKIDPALIAGIRIILDDEMQFDASLRGKLDKVFKNI